MDKVSFAEAGTAVEEEGVAASAGGFYNAASSGNGDIVVGANDEAIDGVFRVEAGFVSFGVGASGTFFGGRELLTDGGRSTSDFAGANFGFNFGLDLEIDSIDGDVVILEGSGDEVEVAVAELFNVESVFDTNDDVAIAT